MFRPLVTPDQVIALVRCKRPAVVSFDLFDTLVFRNVGEPKDVFRIQGRRLRREGLISFSPQTWLDRRKQAERTLARRRAPGEIELAQVYDALLQDGVFASPRARDAALACELDIERQVICLFPDIPRMLRSVSEAGATVVVLSDTYLPKAFIAEQLEPVSHWIDRLYCSSQTGVTKRHGQAFRLLRTGARTLHFGDNRRSDCRRAWQNGIDGRRVEWERQRWLHRNRVAISLLRHNGQEVPPMADPGQPPAAGSLADIGLRWGIVLFDFLIDLRKHARAIGATDIWLTSRDCESLWHVLAVRPDFFGPIAVRYLRASRQATHTVMAGADPDRFQRWRGHAPSADDFVTGKLASRYYRQQLRPETRQILLVDMMSKGRLEVSLRLALPQDIALDGYYFSLQPGHEATNRAGVYLPWRHARMHAGAVELLAGYAEGTCTGFRGDSGGQVEPVLEQAPGDAAPEAYLATLRATLAALLDADTQSADGIEATPIDLRMALVRQIVMFPDKAMAQSLRGWRYSSHHDGDAGDIVDVAVPRPFQWLGVGSRRNRWPSLSQHTAAPQWLVPLLQHVALLRMMVKDWFETGDGRHAS